MPCLLKGMYLLSIKKCPAFSWNWSIYSCLESNHIFSLPLNGFLLICKIIVMHFLGGGQSLHFLDYSTLYNWVEFMWQIIHWIYRNMTFKFWQLIPNQLYLQELSISFFICHLKYFVIKYSASKSARFSNRSVERSC